MSMITYDTEFLDDGVMIDLISLGMVRQDDNSTLYAVSSEFNEARVHANEWLMENVWPSLPTVPCKKGCRCTARGRGHLDMEDPSVRSRRQIARMVENFVEEGDDLWAYYAAYDHVALAQLWGPMKKLPRHIPMYTLDIMHEMRRMGVEKHQLPNQEQGLHNALEDAKHNLVMLEAIGNLVPRRPAMFPKDVF